MKERQHTNQERTMTMGYFSGHGKNHDNVMKRTVTVSWEGPWQCHGRGHDNAMERTV